MDFNDATGLIKHISKLKKIPSGKIRVLCPVEIRGMELDFFVSDVEISQEDQRCLEAGMTLRFSIKGDTRNGFTAKGLKPVDLADYNGSVIKISTPTDPTSSTIVSLDLTLNAVVLTYDSLRNLKLSKPLRIGDHVRLTIRWAKWIEAQHARRKPEFDIVEVLDGSKPRPRSLSQGREEKSVDQRNRVIRVNREASSEELSPQHEHLMRRKRKASEGEIDETGRRRRSRSVGYAPPQDDDIIPYQCYPYMPPQRFPYQYPMMTPEMMYGSFANYYNHSSVWMTPSFMPPFMHRGAQ